MSGKSGGTTTQIIQPTPPPAPSTADAINAYVQSLPALFEAQLKYAPMEAQQQLDLTRQFAIPYAQAYQEAQETLYPGTSALQEGLVEKARAGMTGSVPQGMRDQYRSDLLAQLGENAKSGVGADYVSRNLINQQEQYNQYYQNLGLSLAGRQPLVTPSAPGFTNQMGNYQPGQGLQYTAGNYGTFAAASRPLVSQNQAGTPNWYLGLNAGGNLLQGLGQAGGTAGIAGLAALCWVAAEMFGGWYAPKTVAARWFVINKMPAWFKTMYIRFGKQLSKNKAALFVLRPLFEFFAWQGGKNGNPSVR